MKIVRPFINNPDLADRFEHSWSLGQDLKIDLFYTEDRKGYTDYETYKNLNYTTV